MDFDALSHPSQLHLQQRNSIWSLMLLSIALQEVIAAFGPRGEDAGKLTSTTSRISVSLPLVLTIIGVAIVAGGILTYIGYGLSAMRERKRRRLQRPHTAAASAIAPASSKVNAGPTSLYYQIYTHLQSVLAFLHAGRPSRVYADGNHGVAMHGFSASSAVGSTESYTV